MFLTPVVDVSEKFEIPEIDVSDVPEVFDVPDVFYVPEVYPEMLMRFHIYVILKNSCNLWNSTLVVVED